ncbi:MAG: hypothetical protein ABIO17_12010 [Pseudoxanthomonas sp.]
MRMILLRCAYLMLAALALAACRPQPPATDQPPEPKVDTAQATELRDAIQQPINAAKSVEATTRQAAEQQRAAIDAATTP